MKKKADTRFDGAKTMDPPFIQIEQIAKEFSFSHSGQFIASRRVAGLLSREKIRANLKAIQELTVDAYVSRVVQPAESTQRPSARHFISSLNGNVIAQHTMGPLLTAEIELDINATKRRIGIIAQERRVANGAWMPEHHHEASAAIQRFADLAMPIVFLIDTPGADAGEVANSNNQAHSISKMIAEAADVPVPTLGIIIGVGYSGGAIPLATTNMLLSVRDGIFNTIQPKGLQSIARKYNISWQECAKFAGVAPEELYFANCIDGIIDYSPFDKDHRGQNFQQAIVTAITAIEDAALNFAREYPDIRHYTVKKMLAPFQIKSNQRENHVSLEDKIIARTSLLGFSARYLRYLTVRSRIHSISQDQYGRLSTLIEPTGDLKKRLERDKKKTYLAWLNNPDKVVYDNQLTKNWKYFLAKRETAGDTRNALTRLILGAPKDNFQKARQNLLFHLSLNLYNRWKGNAANNFALLITYLEDEQHNPRTDHWPSLSDVTVLDIIKHKDLRTDFIENCRAMLVFDALYDNAVGNLASIAKEAMDTKSLSRQAVAELLEKSLAGAFKTRDVQGSEKDNFASWLKYFMSHSNRGDMLTRIEQWKSVGFSRLNSSLFVILTYFFERLLPEYYASEIQPNHYKGAINPVRIGRRKDFWNRLTMGYRDLLITRLLREEKEKNNIKANDIIARYFQHFIALEADRMTADQLNFPGFRLSIEDALTKGVTPCGLIVGLADFMVTEGQSRRVGIAVSNVSFQAGAFDMASAEKFCYLLQTCAQQKLPVICFISSGGMQTKEGAAALFSMAVANDCITQFIKATGLPIIVFGFGDCTGGAQASFVTHPMVHTYYLSGTNMPFAGQMVVPSYLPSTSTLANYLSKVPGAMTGLVINPFSQDFDERLRDIDSKIPVPNSTIEQVINQTLLGVLPQTLEDVVREPLPLDPKDLMKPISKVLIHARGCTAVKLIRKAQDNAINIVLVASDPDMTAVPAEMLTEQDTLVCLGGNTSDESYLNAHSVLTVAEYEGVDALHPGIGFLSENAEFANLCINHEINFIGPSAASMTAMGNKSNAIKMVQSLQIPVVPGSHGILSSAEQAAEIAEKIGYPVLLKAVQGGGGKGIQVVENPAEIIKYFNQVSLEARSAFGNGDLYLEKYVTSLRHIEVQLLRDKFGNTKVLGLRDCSVQRNNQKVIEESDSTMLPLHLKQAVYQYTAMIADAVDYVGAGTVEFIYNLAANEVYFMEMNTRLQVEHPVTEATSQIDIVTAQFDIAAGRDIASLNPAEQGYAMEVRVAAEIAAVDSQGILQLLPNPGRITQCHMPASDDIEIISIAAKDKEISPYYDSLIAQIICRGNDRIDVINKLYDYLDKIIIRGIATNIPLLKRILKDETFREGVYNTCYLPEFMAKLDAENLIAEMKQARETNDQVTIDAVKVADSNELKVIAQCSGIYYTAPSPDQPDFVKEGDIIDIKQPLGLIEIMKMFTQISLSSYNGKGVELYPADKQYRIEKIMCASEQQIAAGDLLYIVRMENA